MYTPLLHGAVWLDLPQQVKCPGEIQTRQGNNNSSCIIHVGPDFKHAAKILTCGPLST